MNYDSASHTLTLTDVTISVPLSDNLRQSPGSFAVLAYEGSTDLTIALEGQNTITLTDGAVTVSGGSGIMPKVVSASGTLKVQGSGSLELVNNVTKNGTTVNSTIGTHRVSGEGLIASNLTVDSGSLTVRVPGVMDDACAVSAQNITMNGGSMAAQAGDTTAAKNPGQSSGAHTSFGIFFFGTLKMTAGSILATSGFGDDSFGMGVYANSIGSNTVLEQSGGSIEARAGGANRFSYGMFVNKVTLSSYGTLTAAATPIATAGSNPVFARAVAFASNSAGENNGYVKLGVPDFSKNPNFTYTVKAGESESAAVAKAPKTTDAEDYKKQYVNIVFRTPCNSHQEDTSVWGRDDTSHWRYCSTAGCMERLNVASHQWVEGTPNPAPTYQAEGQRVDSCVCGAAKTVTLPKLIYNIDNSGGDDDSPSNNDTLTPPADSPANPGAADGADTEQGNHAPDGASGTGAQGGSGIAQGNAPGGASGTDAQSGAGSAQGNAPGGASGTDAQSGAGGGQGGLPGTGGASGSDGLSGQDAVEADASRADGGQRGSILCFLIFLLILCAVAGGIYYCKQKAQSDKKA